MATVTLASLKEFVLQNADLLMRELPKMYEESGRGALLMPFNSASIMSGTEDNPAFDGGNLPGTSRMSYVTLEMLDDDDDEVKKLDVHKRIEKMVKSYNPKTQFVMAVEDSHGDWVMTKMRLIKVS